MKLKILEYLIIQVVVIISVTEQLKHGKKIFQFPTDGSTHVTLNGNVIYNSEWVNTSSTSSENQRKNFLLWIQHQSSNEDLMKGEEYKSPVETISQKSSVSDGDILSRTRRTKDCKPALTKCACLDMCSGDLIFEDNFDSMNMTMWHHEIRIATNTNDAEFVSYQNRSEHCYVSNGELHIVPGLLSDTPHFNEKSIFYGQLNLISSCTASIYKECSHTALNANILPPIITARIRTKPSFQFRYGRVEVRAKLPKGDWLFPLILLEPAQNVYGFDDYASGQIRIAFASGNVALIDRQGSNIGGSRILGGVVLTTDPTLRKIKLVEGRNAEHFGNDFHIYSVKWTDKSISLAVDGNEYAIIQGGFHKLLESHKLENAKRWKTGEHMAPFDQEFYITLGVAAGGHADFPDHSRNPNLKYSKPWTNRDPKAIYQFWKAREQWLRTWNGTDAGLHVDYVRVYAL